MGFLYCPAEVAFFVLAHMVYHTETGRETNRDRERDKDRGKDRDGERQRQAGIPTRI